MKIDFSNIPDLYGNDKKAITKGQGKIYCSCCHKTLDEKAFFKTSRLDKHPTGYLPVCRTCASMTIDDSNPQTFLPLLKELDIPYIPTEWRKLLMKKDARDASIIGKYASKMHLAQFNRYRWKDSERLTKEETENMLSALRQETESETEAEEQLQQMLTFQDINTAPSTLPNNTNNIKDLAQVYGLTPDTSKYNLTQEEIDKLKSTWGADYTEDDFLALEQQFHDMKNSYIIQDPLAISNARIICKMTLKMNRFLDIDDVEAVSKISRQLDLFIKTANLAPVQQKDRQSSTFAISQLAYLLEKDGGFIPKWDTTQVIDKVDDILKDMKNFTEHLVLGESNIEEMVKNTQTILADYDKKAESINENDEFDDLENEILQDIGLPEEELEDESTD